jgi:histidinol-phosphate phosphatase family protein
MRRSKADQPRDRTGGERGAKGIARRFVLLDRDGTLVRDEGYTHRVEDYHRLPGVVEGLQRLQAAGYALAIITNQSGIGRGYYSEQSFHAFQAHLLSDLASFDIRIEGTFFCPHRPDEACSCRKPELGLVNRVRDELGADLSRSWVIGDGLGDICLAERAGCRGAVLVTTGRGRETDRKVDPGVPRAANLAAAAEIILSDQPSGS